MFFLTDIEKDKAAVCLLAPRKMRVLKSKFRQNVFRSRQRLALVCKSFSDCFCFGIIVVLGVLKVRTAVLF